MNECRLLRLRVAQLNVRVWALAVIPENDQISGMSGFGGSPTFAIKDALG